MKNLQIFFFTGIIPLFYLCCSSNGGRLSKLEREFMESKIKSMQSIASSCIENNNALELFESAMTPKEMPSIAYAMVILPDGKVIAHRVALEAGKILKDEVTKKVLEYRNSSEILIQELKFNNRDVLEYSLPVFSSTSPGKYIGAVRLAIYED